MNTSDSDVLVPSEMVCLEFLNSEWGDFRGRWRKDELLKAGWLQEFLKKWHFEDAGMPTEDELDALIALRTLMRRIVASLPAGGPADEDLTSLNETFENAPSIQRLTWQNGQFRPEIEPLVKDWNWVMAEIAGSFAELLSEGDLQRLKICENPYCLGIFYDETRSKTKRWCTPSKCGNLWKMRHFRARQKERLSE